MDPQATWDQLLSALVERDWDRTEELATALKNWLGAGGFPPVVLGAPDLGPAWERAICRAGCQFALDVSSRRAVDSTEPATNPIIEGATP